MSSGAIVVRSNGGPEVLVWEQREVGEPGPGEVRLRHQAVGVNFVDVYERSGLYPLPLPFVPGAEGAGVIEALGEEVRGFAVGDRVAYAGGLGGYSETRLVSADRLVRLPPGIAFETAAAAMLKGMTAHMLLKPIGRIGQGSTILVHAAAGGVGLIVCQWAAALGAQVIGAVSTRAKAELAAANGCAHPIVTPEQDFIGAVKRLTGGRGVDVVYDSVGRDTFMASLDCLRRRGLMVSFGQSSGPVEPFTPYELQRRGSLMLTRPVLFDFIAAREELEAAAAALFEVIADGTVRISIGQRFALRDAAAAHRALEARATTGSTVLLP